MIGWEARPPTGQLKRLNKTRRAFMCHGCQAPMGELLSLRSYGRALSRTDGPSFRVNWSDDSETVSWDGGSLRMADLRRMGQHMVQLAEASLARLMYGMPARIQLSKLQDRLSNQNQGYCFVQDPANNLSSAYLELSSRACLDPIGGLMASERWKLDAVQRYLKEETELLVSVMLLCFLYGGQAPRTSEMFSIECQNGSATLRGLYVDQGTLMYVTRHNKSRSSTNQEFQVARYLPPSIAEIVAAYVVYVRPFADMLCRTCYGFEEERRLLFASWDRPRVPWTVVLLTRAMKKLTGEICGVQFGVQVYRQLSIAITEKHVKGISRPFNRYEDKSVSADLEVVFAWQSGHRPLQRGTTYGIDGAYPDSLQPALLRVYSWASAEWHRFLQQDQARERPTDLQSAIQTKGSKSGGASSPLPVHTQRKDTPFQPPWRLIPTKRRTTTVSPPPTAAKRRRFPGDLPPTRNGMLTQAPPRDAAERGPQTKPQTELPEVASGSSSPVCVDLRESNSPPAGRESSAEWEDYERRLEQSQLEQQRRGPSLEDQEMLRRWQSYLDWWKERCPWCEATQGQSTYPPHAFRVCPSGSAAAELSGRLGKYLFKSTCLADAGCPLCAAPAEWDCACCPRPRPMLSQIRLDQCDYMSTIREVVTVLFQQGPESPWFYTIFEMMDDDDPFENTERRAREGDRFVARWLMQVAEGWEFWPGVKCTNIVVVFANWTRRLIEGTERQTQSICI